MKIPDNDSPNVAYGLQIGKIFEVHVTIFLRNFKYMNFAVILFLSLFPNSTLQEKFILRTNLSTCKYLNFKEKKLHHKENWLLRGTAELWSAKPAEIFRVTFYFQKLETKGNELIIDE